MVVDDDGGILMLVQAQLRQKGHQVIGAMSGQEALDSVAEKGAPDVVVLDVGLPDMDGLELLTALRERLEMRVSWLPTVQSWRVGETISQPTA